MSEEPADLPPGDGPPPGADDLPPDDGPPPGGGEAPAEESEKDRKKREKQEAADKKKADKEAAKKAKEDAAAKKKADAAAEKQRKKDEKEAAKKAKEEEKKAKKGKKGKKGEDAPAPDDAPPSGGEAPAVDGGPPGDEAPPEAPVPEGLPPEGEGDDGFGPPLSGAPADLPGGGAPGDLPAEQPGDVPAEMPLEGGAGLPEHHAHSAAVGEPSPEGGYFDANNAWIDDHGGYDDDNGTYVANPETAEGHFDEAQQRWIATPTEVAPEAWMAWYQRQQAAAAAAGGASGPPSHSGSLPAEAPPENAASAANMAAMVGAAMPQPEPEAAGGGWESGGYEEVTFSEPGPLGLVIVKRESTVDGNEYLVLDQIRDGSQADKMPQLRQGLLLKSVKGKTDSAATDVEHMSVADVSQMMAAENRPVTVTFAHRTTDVSDDQYLYGTARKGAMGLGMASKFLSKGHRAQRTVSMRNEMLGGAVEDEIITASLQQPGKLGLKMGPSLVTCLCLVPPDLRLTAAVSGRGARVGVGRCEVPRHHRRPAGAAGPPLRAAAGAGPVAQGGQRHFRAGLPNQ